jgi:Beta/Gamma crystallin
MADVIIYEHANFQGRSQVLAKDRYDDAAGQLSFGNDTISSLQVPPGLVARLYEHYHFQGRYVDIREDTPAVNQFWNDRTSSIVVYGEDEQPPFTKEVMIFEHANYGGKSQILGRGKYDTAQIAIGNKTLSSALVPTGMVLRLYEQASFGGAFTEIRGDTPAVSLDWNDRTSSIVVDEEGMPSITSWMRLEPRSRNVEMNTSLQARIYDPLWLLARQWQMGEFQGEDNGSPVMARWRAEAARLSRFHSGAIPPNTRVNAPNYDGSRLPLETLVERETVRPPSGPSVPPGKLRLAAQAGQHFLRMLNGQPMSKDYREGFIRRYPFPALTPDQHAALDSETLNFFGLMALRVPDARALYTAFHSTSPGEIFIEPALEIAPGDLAEVEKTARLWMLWFETLFSEPEGLNPSWLPERMEYAFSVATRLSDREHVLTAQEYSEGHLDWYAFDENAGVTIGAASDPASREITCTVIPAPVSFRGMPTARFWEFEDAQVDFGRVDAGPTDLGRMLLVEFALAYGNDWFVIPVELEVGSLYRSRSFVITDTFGVRTLIKPSSELGPPHSAWRMFQHSYLRGSGIHVPESNLFFLPPSLLQSLESRPLEEVLFLRDEMANLVWGVERVIESSAEQSLNRFETYLEQKRRRGQESAPEPGPGAETLRYRLTTEIPDYWVPLLPVKTEKGLRLQRGAVLNTQGSPEPVHALGRILESGHELSVFEEEVPREGVRVTRSYQYTRWIDGSSHLWIGRRKGIGRGEGSSGLQFDSLDAKD